MNITYWDAVLNLVNNTEISGPVNGPITEYTFHNNQTPPTEEAIQAKLAELKAEYDALQYQRDRASAYPSITDVVVALAEKEEGDDSMWQEITAQRAKVKADNPKPT